MITPTLTGLPKDVPVMGSVPGPGSDGEQPETGPIDFVRRPPALMRIQKAYALYVEGDLMDPEHKPGELRFVNPMKKYALGDTVVVQTRSSDGADVVAMIGRLLSKSRDSVKIGSLNPVASVTVPTTPILRIHKVLTMNELFGV